MSKAKTRFICADFYSEKMNRKDDYDSYEIEEPSDEEGALSRYVTEHTHLNMCTHVNKQMWTSSTLHEVLLIDRQISVFCLFFSVLRMSWIFFSTGLRIRRRSWSGSTWRGRASPPVEMSLRRRWRQSSAAPWRAWRAAGQHLQLKVSQTRMHLAL